VFDDQLVQSDGNRMDWLRGLLAEKARIFQIIVLTCRPSDYLGTATPLSGAPNTHPDQAHGVIRANVVSDQALESAPEGFRFIPAKWRELADQVEQLERTSGGTPAAGPSSGACWSPSSSPSTSCR